MVFEVRLTYKFNNDEKKVDIDKKEYLIPADVEFFFREGDSIYVDSGDEVKINQLLIESSLGVKTYSSVAGVVERKNDSLVIKNDNSDATLDYGDSILDISELKKDEIIDICQKLGVSYDNKLISNKLKFNNKVLVVNGLDIEPYQFNSNYIFQDHIKNMLDTIDLLSRRLNLDAYLMLSKYDDNNVYSVKTLLTSYPNVNLIVVNEVFPYNTNMVLLHKYFKEYKYDEVLLFDALSLFKLFVALKERKVVTEKMITVMLDDSSKAYVINSRYGANLKEVISKTIGCSFENKDIYLNNFMRKIKCVNIDSLTVTDNIKAIYIFEKDDSVPTKCIKCGKCVEICPVGINPLDRKLDSACIRCGLCNYVCPANKNLISREKEI